MTNGVRLRRNPGVDWQVQKQEDIKDMQSLILDIMRQELQQQQDKKELSHLMNILTKQQHKNPQWNNVSSSNCCRINDKCHRCRHYREALYVIPAATTHDAAMVQHIVSPAVYHPGWPDKPSRIKTLSVDDQALWKVDVDVGQAMNRTAPVGAVGTNGVSIGINYGDVGIFPIDDC